MHFVRDRHAVTGPNIAIGVNGIVNQTGKGVTDHLINGEGGSSGKGAIGGGRNVITIRDQATHSARERADGKIIGIQIQDPTRHGQRAGAKRTGITNL